MTAKSIKVIFDTNVWISFLIGKQLAKLTHLISEEKIIIIITDEILMN